MKERFSKFYVLDEHHRVREVRDMVEWGRFFESPARIVAQTAFECGVKISTVFLGIDHRLFGDGPPLLFETMVFEMTIDGDGEMCRYSSWDDAEIGHKAAVGRATKHIAAAGLSTKVVAQ